MEREVEFKLGRQTLRGSFFIPQGKGPFPSVIFFHGSGGDGETHFKLAKVLSENGILGFAFNYRGCGKSEGKFENQTISMGIKDAKAAVDFLLSQKEVDRTRMGFGGGSFGGFISCLLSAESKPKSLLLIAPAAYSKESYKIHRDSDERLRGNFENSESYKNLFKFKGQLLVIKSEFDDVLPVGMVERYLEKAKNVTKKEEFILKGAKHRISINPAAQKILTNKVKDWFVKTL